LREAFKARDTLRVRVRLGKDRAELVKIIGKEPGNKDLAGRKKKAQRKIWKHADLGTFKFDDGWVSSLSLPAFKAFKYDSEGSRARSFKTDICFAVDLPEDVPTPRTVAVAMRVIKNQESLAGKLKKAIFDDINGRGPRSGMWWRGNIQTINEYVADESGRRKLKPLKAPADLEHFLGRPAIDIRESVYGFDKPCAIISFSALFEPEHGVGILTDGVRILGLGDCVDVTPFGCHSVRVTSIR
jgi:hypothetical protein